MFVCVARGLSWFTTSHGRFVYSHSLMMVLGLPIVVVLGHIFSRCHCFTFDKATGPLRVSSFSSVDDGHRSCRRLTW